MSFPYPVFGVITDSDSANVVTKVILRNDRTGEKVSVVSDSDGKYVLDAANLASGYMTTDRLTVVAAYGDEDGESSFLISSENHETDIELSTIAESSDCTYCQPQDVLDELEKTTDDVSYEKLRKRILRNEEYIDDRARSSFKPTTVTDEIIDFNQYDSYKSPENLYNYGSPNYSTTRRDYAGLSFNDTIKLKYGPVISITSLEVNRAGPSATDDWETLTEQEGSSGDFIVKKETNIIQFVAKVPTFGKRRVKITYIYGTSTVSKVIEKLCLLLTVRDTLSSKGNKDRFSPVNLSVDGFSKTSGISGSIAYFKWLTTEIEKLWEEIGDMPNLLV